MCAENPELGWGLFCYKGGKKCYGPTERCKGTPDHWIFEKGCCGDYKCVPNPEMGWGSFCMRNYTPLPASTYFVDPTTTAAPAVTDAPSSYVAPATTAASEVTDAPSYYVAPTTTAAAVVTDAPSYYVPPATTAAPVVTDAPSYYEPPATTAAPKVTHAPSYYVPPATTAAPEVTDAPATTAAPKYSTPPATTDGGCGGVWKGSGNKVVIGCAGSAQGQWRNTGNGIMYKPWDWNAHGIDGQGSSTLTYKFTVEQSGKYLITMQTKSAHQTEFNDVWVQMPGHSLYLTKGYGGWNQSGWLKGYQNRGGFAKELWSKDHDPQAITVGHLNAGQTYSIQISGRSSQFHVERIILVKCEGACSFWDGTIQSSLDDTTPSEYC